MKNVPYNSYNIIFESLIDSGYSESESEQIICDVINDLRNMDDVAKRLHLIYKQRKDNTVS